METNHRILLAEDEPKLGQIIQEELTRQGYQTDVAYDGLVAEKLFQATSLFIGIARCELTLQKWSCSLQRVSGKLKKVFLLSCLPLWEKSRTKWMHLTLVQTIILLNLFILMSFLHGSKSF